MAITETPVKTVSLTELHRDTGRLISDHADGGLLEVTDRYGRTIAVLVTGPQARQLVAGREQDRC